MSIPRPSAPIAALALLLAASPQARAIDLGDFIGAGCLYSRRPELGYLKPLIRASALQDVRYREDMRIGEDYNLILRLLIGGARMRLIPQALYRYRKHGASISAVLKPEHVRQMIDGDLGVSAEIARQSGRVRRSVLEIMITVNSSLPVK